ncbi:YbaN family protein [Candidatus Poriferisocius sp.]|uniref:YbaN family protein n=1 Tax=Candidatus Poriferisocius sp. TaxID=3101276 RepID=UPI003B5C7A4F
MTSSSSPAEPGDPAALSHSKVARNPLVRGLWVIGGLVCVAVGAIGVIVPGLPSTVFFIMAAAAFSRSSERMEQWVLNLPGVGKLVADYRSGLGMPWRAKVIAGTMIVVAVGLSSGLAIGSWTWRGVVIGLGIVGLAYIFGRVPTKR